MVSNIIRAKDELVREQRMAVTFAGVVVTTLVCTIPGLLLVILVVQDGGDMRDLGFYETIFIVRDILFTLNSAVNIFIYSCLDNSFRRELRKFLQSLIRKPSN